MVIFNSVIFNNPLSLQKVSFARRRRERIRNYYECTVNAEQSSTLRFKNTKNNSYLLCEKQDISISKETNSKKNLLVFKHTRKKKIENDKGTFRAHNVTNIVKSKKSRSSTDTKTTVLIHD